MTPNADYGLGFSGATAGVNSLRWWSCYRCGACIVEYDDAPEVNRERHDRWHEGVPPDDGSAS